VEGREEGEVKGKRRGREEGGRRKEGGIEKENV
jgi:hypothetical protein